MSKRSASCSTKEPTWPSSSAANIAALLPVTRRGQARQADTCAMATLQGTGDAVRGCDSVRPCRRPTRPLDSHCARRARRDAHAAAERRRRAKARRAAAAATHRRWQWFIAAGYLEARITAPAQLLTRRAGMPHVLDVASAHHERQCGAPVFFTTISSERTALKGGGRRPRRAHTLRGRDATGSLRGLGAARPLRRRRRVVRRRSVHFRAAAASAARARRAGAAPAPRADQPQPAHGERRARRRRGQPARAVGAFGRQRRNARASPPATALEGTLSSAARAAAPPHARAPARWPPLLRGSAADVQSSRAGAFASARGAVLAVAARTSRALGLAPPRVRCSPSRRAGPRSSSPRIWCSRTDASVEISTSSPLRPSSASAARALSRAACAPPRAPPRRVAKWVRLQTRRVRDRRAPHLGRLHRLERRVDCVAAPRAPSRRWRRARSRACSRRARSRIARPPLAVAPPPLSLARAAARPVVAHFRRFLRHLLHRGSSSSSSSSCRLPKGAEKPKKLCIDVGSSLASRRRHAGDVPPPSFARYLKVSSSAITDVISSDIAPPAANVSSGFVF